VAHHGTAQAGRTHSGSPTPSPAFAPSRAHRMDAAAAPSFSNLVPGPGAYAGSENSLAARLGGATTTGFRSRTGRAPLATDEALGTPPPGTYETARRAVPRNGEWTEMSATFRSRAARLLPLVPPALVDVPGPGFYDAAAGAYMHVWHSYVCVGDALCVPETSVSDSRRCVCVC
jgi:hypothetical protein